MPLPSSVKVQHTHHARSYCMESFHAKLRFVSQAQRAHSWLQFVQAINADAEVLRAAVCNRCPVRYSRAEDVMTASLSSPTQQESAYIPKVFRSRSILLRSQVLQNSSFAGHLFQSCTCQVLLPDVHEIGLEHIRSSRHSSSFSLVR